MYYIKNYSQIKILKIPEILTKISKTTGLDHIYKGYLSQTILYISVVCLL